MLDTIRQLSKRWFLREPALFAIYCFHQLVENRDMQCEVRSGKGRIEYNPDMLATCSPKNLEMIFRAELIRLLLQHPYARKPEGCSQRTITLASDFVITSYYPEMGSLFASPFAYDLPEKSYYEWYAGMIRDKESSMSFPSLAPSPEQKGILADSIGNGDAKMSDIKGPLTPQNGPGQSLDSKDDEIDIAISNNGGGSSAGMACDSQQDSKEDATPSTLPGQCPCNYDGNVNGDGEGASVGGLSDEQQSLKDRSELWEENPWMQEEVKNVVTNITDWGTLPGSMVEQIIANAKPKVDYRKVLSGFRANTLSSKRKLTRMRPNRRTEFENMGSLYQLQTRYLCAVDVSGSISSEDLNNFFSIINRFFKYGVEKIDVITCDTEIHDVIEFKKAKSMVSVNGRGGTDFQPVINYMEEHPEYDGLIFFTDGYAPTPEIHKKGLIHNILWFIDCERAYNDHQDDLRKIGKVCYLSR